MQLGTPQLRRLAQYEILETRASAGKVQIYRAADTANQRSVTLKTISRDSDDPETAATIAEFQEQARIASFLDHPGIISIYEYGEESGIAFLATEYVEGCALKEGMRVPIADAISMTIQLLSALDYAHGRGLVHGTSHRPNFS
jgi:eukaryotic-like serine/threonine-protein kinase